ncbi:hypothetical protein [Paracoccus aminovorans]|uniref:hypothetical protein n=1 Tax=Paracoccus aminovorans TaxID=34004 RepID=UPI002B263D85|nr:hypothetical protein [Paracoccus aminovorans]
MNMIYTKAYRAAFDAYLRKGTPIPLFLKQAGTTAWYVWRCQGDDRVRMTHRANDGRVFAGTIRRTPAIRARTRTAAARQFPISPARQNSRFTTSHPYSRRTPFAGET